MGNSGCASDETEARESGAERNTLSGTLARKLREAVEHILYEFEVELREREKGLIGKETSALGRGVVRESGRHGGTEPPL